MSIKGPVDPWATYGHQEPIVNNFITKYSGASLAVTSLEITAGGLLRNEQSFTDKDALWDFLTVLPVPPSTSLRVLVVKELSGEGLQLLSTALGIHLGFWAWIISDDASDGFWLNTHNNGKILSFDLPCLEFYATTTVPTTGVVREGRLKHLSSRHRLFGSGLQSAETYEVYVNRRVSAYLVPHGDSHTFVYFSEDCRAVSSIRLETHTRTDPITAEWFITTLKETERDVRKRWTQEPVGLILRCVQKLLRYESHYDTDPKISMSLMSVSNVVGHGMSLLSKPNATWRILKDGTLPESLPTQLPVNNLYDVGTYPHRDIVQTLYRFTLQLGKYDGYLNYLCAGTLDHFRPKKFLPDVANLKNNVLDLRRRLDGCRDRGNGSLALINNYISLQQARLAHEQATIAAHVAIIQQRDSQSNMRLSVVATVFLPLSFAASWLSTNTTTPLWVFFVIAVLSMCATTVAVLFLKWMQKGWLKGLVKRGWAKVFKRPWPMSAEEEMSLKIDPSLLV